MKLWSVALFLFFSYRKDHKGITINRQEKSTSQEMTHCKSNINESEIGRCRRLGNLRNINSSANNNDETIELKYFDWSHLSEIFHPQHEEVIEDYFQEKINVYC